MTSLKYIYFLSFILLGACAQQGEQKLPDPAPKSVGTAKADPSIVGTLADRHNLDTMHINNYKQHDRYGRMVWLADHPSSLMAPNAYTRYDPYTPFPY